MPLNQSPGYPPAFVAWLVGARPAVVRRLVTALGAAPSDPITFPRLIEVRVATSLFRSGLGRQLTPFTHWLRELLSDAHPLAHQDWLAQPAVFLGGSGPGRLGRPWATAATAAAAAARAGQVAEQLVFDPGAPRPARWWCFGPDEPVVIDPAVQGGYPVLTGTRIRTAVAARHVGRLARAAAEWGVPEEWILTARRLERRRPGFRRSFSTRRSIAAS